MNTNPDKNFWIYHAVVMWFVFNVMLLIQFASHRYYRHKWKYSLIIHIVNACLMLCFSAVSVYFIATYLRVHYLLPLFAIKSVHMYIGWVNISFIMINAILGVIAYRNRTSGRNDWNTQKVLKMKKLHRFCTYTLIFTTQLGMLFGMIFKKTHGV